LEEEVHSCEPIRGSTAGIVNRTRELLGNAVRRQLVSDVPVGVFLSGGIDSSAITAFASRYYGSRISTYAAGFDDPYGVDERNKARHVASHFGTDHHELFIEGRDLAPVVEELVDRHGGPFADAANIPLYLMAEQLSGSVKVVLQGDGGDEVFGGYRRYSTVRYRFLLHHLTALGQITASLLPKTFLRQRVKRYINIYRQKDLASTVALLLTQEGLEQDLLNVFNEEYRNVIGSSDPTKRYREVQKKFADLDTCQQMSMMDLLIILPNTYLEKVDRATMAHGLEARVPFLDNELVNYVVALPGKRKMPLGRKKWLLKMALRGIVPDHVLDSPKTGFGVPYHNWLLGPLREHFYDHLVTFQRRAPGIVSESRITDWFREADQGRRDLASRLWKLYNLLIWSNRFEVKFEV
jgi:asparagine synthase (glutamine-hydrolysing)